MSSRFFLIRYFLYLHFKCYPLSWFPLRKSSILSPTPCLPTNPLLLPGPGIPLHWGIEPSQDQGPLLPLMLGKAILCYICSWSHGTLHVYSLVGGLVPGRSGRSGWLILLFFLWGCKLFQLLHPFSKSSIGVLVLSPMVGICLCICQALAESLRRQLYQAPDSKNFLASAIVFRFGDRIWDGSPGGTVSGWPFLQFLLQTLFPYFLP